MALAIWNMFGGLVHLAAGRLSAARASVESLPAPQPTGVTEPDILRTLILAEVSARADDRRRRCCRARQWCRRAKPARHAWRRPPGHPCDGTETAVRLDFEAQHLVMRNEGRPHCISVRIPPTGRSLDIGEQKCHHPRRSSRPSADTMQHGTSNALPPRTSGWASASTTAWSTRNTGPSAAH
jgi:hypothetical protein